ncbi:MAG: 7-carboxy-7-deazaguanine synthase QueE [Bacteroidales bacterium]|nr:7-carboxy-7-deazaguanine synthase QueE [Bacteroidales bacterium]MDE6147386.1 7-carboxy-7-deazaguanine synthase QueE [Bacteroidales bacterium]
MAEYIIRPGELPENPSAKGPDSLSVCELFIDAAQGEGAYAGCPAVFLRLSGCHVRCGWCDTADILGKSTATGTEELLDIFKGRGITERLKMGHHLVVTGGSPLLQQDVLTSFLARLKAECRDRLFIEIENECSIPVRQSNAALWDIADCWNNSPKLSHSGIAKNTRYNPEALAQMSNAREAWFKFVVKDENDWSEIEDEFIVPGYVRREQIILMPEGQTRMQLNPQKKQEVLEMAVRHSVRYGGRLHIDIYDNRKGV